MTRLREVLSDLGLEAKTELSGRWVRLEGHRCAVYVAEVASGTRYYTWCEYPEEPTVEVYLDPREAILAGLQRAGGAAGDERETTRV